MDIYAITGVFITVHESLTPASDIIYNLGTASLRWNTLFVDNIDVATDILPEAGNTVDLGTSTLYFDLVYFDLIETNFIQGLGSATQVIITDDFDPNGGGNYDLGDATNYWQVAYVDYFLTDDIEARTGSSMDINGSLISSSNWDIGSVAHYWQNGYIDDMFCDTISSRSGSSVNFLDNIDIGAGHLTMYEITAPTVTTGFARIYAVINGANTELRVAFGNSDVLLGAGVRA
tara:strand:- start:2675 stop:3370 length:696 start_codon:yes stop_codon:yes gene_type:complete